MTAVITGDIIDSQRGQVDSWMEPLKRVLNAYGDTPKDWETYRGDSFQLKVDVKTALLAAIHLKAAIKQTKVHDLRMAIGLGEESYSSARVSESNGSAFVHSGECFDSLKKKKLAIKSPRSAVDEPLNIMIQLALLTMDHWSQVVSTVIKTAIENPEKTQSEWAQLLDRSQSNISEALSRGGYEEIMKMNDYYIKAFCPS